MSTETGTGDWIGGWDRSREKWLKACRAVGAVQPTLSSPRRYEPLCVFLFTAKEATQRSKINLSKYFKNKTLI